MKPLPAALAGTVVALAAACGTARPAHPVAAQHTASPSLSTGQRNFVTGVRDQYNLPNVSDSDLVSLGRIVCQYAAGGQDAAISYTERYFTPSLDAVTAGGLVQIAEGNLCPSEEPTPAPAPAPSWHTVATFTGSANTNTPQFTISDANGGNWVMKYTYDCSGQLGGTGNFAVTEDGGQDSSGTASPVEINNLDAGQTSQTYVYNDAGTHYLQVGSECPYTITVLQQY